MEGPFGFFRQSLGKDCNCVKLITRQAYKSLLHLAKSLLPQIALLAHEDYYIEKFNKQKHHTALSFSVLKMVCIEFLADFLIKLTYT